MTILGENLSNYMVNHEMNNSRFADELMNYVDEPVTDRAVGKWKSGETFPTLKNLIAISSILGVTLDELVKDKVIEENMEHKRSVITKFNELETKDKETLKKLIRGGQFEKGEFFTEIYFPLEFMGRMLDFSTAKFYNNREINDFYKNIAGDAFRKMRLEELLSKDIDDLDELFDYIEKYTSVLFDDKKYKSIIYDISDEKDTNCTVYKQLQTYWEETQRYDVYNVIDYGEGYSLYRKGDTYGYDKSTYFKVENRLMKLYNDSYLNLIESGLIDQADDCGKVIKADKPIDCATEWATFLCHNEGGYICTEEQPDDDSIRLFDSLELENLKFKFKLNLKIEDIERIMLK